MKRFITENTETAYRLIRESTSQLTGYFSAEPEENYTTEEAIELLASRPMDDFLHKFILRQTGSLPQKDLNSFPAKSKHTNIFHKTLIAEHIFLTKGRNQLKKTFTSKEIRTFIPYTPLIFLKSYLEPNQALHEKWIDFFRNNIEKLRPLSGPDNAPPPLPGIKTKSHPETIPVNELAENFLLKERENPVPPGITAEKAEAALEKAGIPLGQLMRHESSLSPVGLLRNWQFSTRIRNKRNRFTLSGEQTSYGRGLSLDDARASLMMEIVERCSAFASISENGPENFEKKYPMRYASYSKLAASVSTEESVINPSEMALEISWQDQPIHWICGDIADAAGGHNRHVWVPAQAVFLFCNLDEPALFSGLGSTGFASGSSPEQAKVSALLEIIERHQAATIPYNHATCFQLIPRDNSIANILDTYRQEGINLWFQDISPDYGIPCCRCIVIEQSGKTHIGTAAHLNARKAVLSAITETTCPFPKAPPTIPVPEDLTPVGYENLPDFSTGSSKTDLRLMETLLIRNSLRPAYIDLTRKDIGIPVVRALIPGREILGDFDRYSRLHPDLYKNYLNIFKSRVSS